jgi:integrase
MSAATTPTYKLISANPCMIPGAAQTDRVVNIKPASIAELDAIAAAMPRKYKALVLLAGWAALRFGELAELRRGDIDIERGVVHVRRAVTTREGSVWIGEPKSDAGKRDVYLPPHIIPALTEHLEKYVSPGTESLLFPAASGERHLAASTLYKPYKRARKAAGRPDLRFHDLRHTGSVLAAATGASLAELMQRLGHSTVGASLRYQHAAQGRDQAIARALSALVESES